MLSLLETLDSVLQSGRLEDYGFATAKKIDKFDDVSRQKVSMKVKWMHVAGGDMQQRKPKQKETRL